jgi:hypothetical protein
VSLIPQLSAAARQRHQVIVFCTIVNFGAGLNCEFLEIHVLFAMPSTSVVQRTLLPLQSLALGRFVADLNNPLYDFIDPKGDERPEVSVHTQNDFEQILEICSASKFKSSLSAFLHVNHEKAVKDVGKITATQALTYEIVNTQAWFSEVCSLLPVRTWLEGTVERDRDAYLVVGYQTVTDAKTVEESFSIKGIDGNIQGSIPFGASMGLVLPSGVNPLEAGVAGNRGENGAQKRKITTPGEQIYAVSYQKVRFKWFSSRSIERSFLEKGTRWKIYWAVRSDADEEDIVEAELKEDLEFDGTCEKYLGPNGQEEYLIFN